MQTLTIPNNTISNNTILSSGTIEQAVDQSTANNSSPGILEKWFINLAIKANIFFISCLWLPNRIFQQRSLHLFFWLLQGKCPMRCEHCFEWDNPDSQRIKRFTSKRKSMSAIWKNSLIYYPCLCYYQLF